MAKWEVTEPCGMLKKLQKKFGDDKVKSYIYEEPMEGIDPKDIEDDGFITMRFGDK